MSNKKSGWTWVPSLYFAEGLPYVIVMTVSVIMYKNLKVENSEIAFYTSWLYLPWVIKPFWSPFVDLLKTKRWWIITMQTLLCVGFAAIAFLIPTSFFFQSTLAVFWIIAFCSATHDIAADGFYMLAQDEQSQSFFVGIRNIFYRIAMIFGQGLLVFCAGILSRYFDSVQFAWSIVFFLMCVLFLSISIYHRYKLPNSQTDAKKSIARIDDLFISFFRKKDIIVAMLFILLYRLGEAQLAKIASPFLLDDVTAGGLGLSNEQVGIAYGTIGVIALLLGGVFGGIVAARDGLKRWLWPMILFMNLPNFVYVFFAYIQPSDFWIICSGISLEQFGYGFGFTAFTLYLMQFSQGEYKTAHYAICTGFMALGMMLPGMISGYMQEWLGYEYFFLYVVICCIPGMIVASLLKIDSNENKKSA